MSDQQEQPQTPPWRSQYWVAIGLIAVFVALVVVMLVVSDVKEETVWQRRVYLFGSVEAVVFTAVGWMFGREVHRTAVESAQQEAQQAKEEASAARTEAKQRSDQAAVAERAAAEERTRALTVAKVIEHSQPSAAAASIGGTSYDAAAGGGASSSAAAPTVDLKALVRDLYSGRI